MVLKSHQSSCAAMVLPGGPVMPIAVWKSFLEAWACLEKDVSSDEGIMFNPPAKCGREEKTNDEYTETTRDRSNSWWE
jgi:hypothetical protein